jgi:hypothetical protein
MRNHKLIKLKKLIIFIILNVYIINKKIELFLGKSTSKEELYILEKKKYTSILRLFTIISINLDLGLSRKFLTIEITYNKNNLY